MSAPAAAKIMVFAGDQYACVKIAGRANFNVSLDFKTVLTELHRKGYRSFAMELSECVLMDSTFLGVLTGFGLNLSLANGNGEPHLMELFNPNPRIVELLENLGVLSLFTIREGTLPVCAETTPQIAEPSTPSREEVTRNCLEAHKTLMAVNPNNAIRFKDVTRFLAEDLKKMQQR